jgi:tetratricopeptide (TPR) repeat protein
VRCGIGWAIAAPGNWSVFAQAPPPTVLYLVGDARDGVPLFDGTLKVIKAGIDVRRSGADGTPIKARLERDLKELKDSGNFVPTKPPQVTDVTLADGTKASLLRAEFVRRENGRLSINHKLYCQDARGRHVVATGFITCSRPGVGFVRAIHLPEFVEAHVTSLVLALPDKIDQTRLPAAYAALDWNASAAIKQTSLGNALLEKQDHAGAIKAFREAIRYCPHVPAAHNGLAWALLETKGAPAPDLDEALREAKTAVEQTEELDYSALDTLAYAHQRRGDRDAALAAVRKAMKLAPNDPDLRRRLDSIGSDEDTR